METAFIVNGIIGGLILLGLSFSGIVSGVLRVITFTIGLISLAHVFVIVDDLLRLLGSDREGFTNNLSGSLYESITKRDREITYGSGVGRVYLRPRLPLVSNGVRVNVKGNPGSKIIYWPVGGAGIGGRNQDLDLHGATLQDIRTRALGVGVTVLDEEGKGLALTEEGVGELLFREVMGDKGGPVNRVRLSQ